MKMNLNLLACAIIVVGVSPPVWAQSDFSRGSFSEEKPLYDFTRIQLKNLQGEALGRFTDLGIDLVNARIVEVLVVADPSLGIGNKIVAVPPSALIPDQINAVYRINTTTETFKAAPAIDLSQWADSGRSDLVAATYRHFAQDTYFNVGNSSAGTTENLSNQPKVGLGYMERSSKIVNMPVRNINNEKFGTVWSMALDIPNGRILSVIVLAPGNSRTKSVIPATSLAFSPQRNGLVLSETKQEFANEPRLVFNEAYFGKLSTYKEETFDGPAAKLALAQNAQSVNPNDLSQTERITQQIRAAQINGRNVKVGLTNGRVTLRGYTDTDEDKRRIAAIANSISGPQLVDNQIVVGKPITTTDD